ncbi:MAG: hypothetical protein AABZ31_03195, partial [Bdellovibrionota bacterium]
LVSTEKYLLVTLCSNNKIQEGIYFLKGGFQGRKKKTAREHGWVVKKIKGSDAGSADPRT